MLEEQLRDAWQKLTRNVPIQSVLHFTPEGLVFGAGTVLVPADGNRRLQKLNGQEARILALLPAAYGKAVSPSVLGNIDRAAKSWREGDDCLAYIYLAHAGLSEPQDPYESARCLFMADALLKTGMGLRAILKALKFDATYINAVEKFYNPLQPRVPAGSGRISGQWTRLLSVLSERVFYFELAGSPRLSSESCSFHRQTRSRSKTMCLTCQACATPGIETKASFF